MSSVSRYRDMKIHGQFGEVSACEGVGQEAMVSRSENVHDPVLPILDFILKMIGS